MVEGVGKVMEFLSRVTIPDGARVETEWAAAEKAKGKPREKPTSKKVAEATCGKEWTFAAQWACGEGCIGVHCPGSSIVMGLCNQRLLAGLNQMCGT